MPVIDWSQPDAFAQCEARCEATRARHAAAGSNPMDAALAEIDAASTPVVAESYTRRDVRMIAAEAKRIAARPSLLDDIPGLAAWSRPMTIIATCESLLERGDRRATALRLRGVIAYAHQAIRTTVICDCGGAPGCPQCDGSGEVDTDDAEAA